MSDKDNDKPVQIIVIEGEAWATVNGASICTITAEEFERLRDGEIRPRDLKPISEVTLRSFG